MPLSIANRSPSLRVALVAMATLGCLCACSKSVWMAIDEVGPDVYTVRINTRSTTEQDAQKVVREELCEGRPFRQSAPMHGTGEFKTASRVRTGNAVQVQTNTITTPEIEWTFECLAGAAGRASAERAPHEVPPPTAPTR